ncbi:hypothetical protein I5M27_02445 [Adhaeribacter sp. BT258]|uniref:Uncharacterized protein n=1 Tax=Adhaeribacter terrigena TaxID=2793070 RepID=A0ABS1C001_9BACT|nr:hypothetical protein [Adhaeribacter terrigena]MBK0401825.1 hypothetical protein [Adhaeribacter terrigena]
MLMIHLTSWALLQVAPAGTGYVVFKKECFRSEARATLQAVSRNQQNPEQQVALPTSEQSEQPVPEVKVCISKLAPPPVAFSVSVLPPFTLSETAPFQQAYYHFLSTSEEPDPPRFA